MMYPWFLVHHYLNQECQSKSLRTQCNKDMILHPPMSMPYLQRQFHSPQRQFQLCLPPLQHLLCLLPQHLPLPRRPSKPAQRYSNISMISTFGTILMHTAYLEANFKADKHTITLRVASRTLSMTSFKLVP